MARRPNNLGDFLTGKWPFRGAPEANPDVPNPGEEITWGDTARELLARRDRFTRQAIENDFKENHLDRQIVLDAADELYATPVADDRYAVIWRRLRQDLIDVRAVVASRLTSTDGAELKSSLEKTVDFETNGLMTKF